MSVIDELIGNASSYSESFDSGICRCLRRSGLRSSRAWTRASTPTAYSAYTRATHT